MYKEIYDELTKSIKGKQININFTNKSDSEIFMLEKIVSMLNIKPFYIFNINTKNNPGKNIDKKNLFSKIIMHYDFYFLDKQVETINIHLKNYDDAIAFIIEEIRLILLNQHCYRYNFIIQ